MAGLLMDVRGAWRLVLHNRTISLLILLTFALGFGANVAILAVARGVLLRPLPYHEPERLVMLWGRRGNAGAGSTGRGLATPRWYREFHARQRSFSSLAAVELWNGNPSAVFDLAATDGAERLRGAFATRNLFETIGVTAALGRTFRPDDPADVTVISHELWQRLFGGTPRVLGSRLELATGRGRERAVRVLTIVGVLPPRVQFSYPESTDVWLPLLPEQFENPRLQDAIMYRLVARLRPGTSQVQAESDLAAAKAGMALDLERDMDNFTFWLEPVHEYAVGEARPAMRLLSTIALLVFAVACLNVASLQLAQAVERRRALAVHLAIGASRGRVVRQLLTESTFIALISAIVTVTLVAGLEPLLQAAIPPPIPRLQEIGVDLFTVGWTTALVGLAVALSSAVPAWRGSAVSPGLELVQGRTTTQSRAAVVWRHAIGTAQVSVVFVLLVVAGLLLRSFWQLQHVDLGFDGNRVFTAEMRLLDPRYFDGAQLAAFQDQLLARVRTLPGVERASITSSVPMRGVDFSRFATRGGQRVLARARDVDPDYFAVMGIALLAGRTFDRTDIGSSTPVIVLSQSLAQRLFGDESAVGQPVSIREGEERTVVGVVADVRHVRVEEAAEPGTYVPRAQESSEIICLVMRMTPGAPDPGAAVRAVVASIDPMQPVMAATTVGRIVSESMAERRFYATVTAAIAMVTLLLAAAGLYGVTAYTVTARTREIGVRAALGADAREIVSMLVRESLRPALLGVAVGVVLAFWVGRLLEQFLFEVRSVDGVTYASAAAGVVAFMVFACLLPSMRAARLSPTLALREE